MSLVAINNDSIGKFYFKSNTSSSEFNHLKFSFALVVGGIIPT